MKINKQCGFSLLEILVAFSILAVSLSILLNIFASGVNTAAVAEDYTHAVQIAESFMAKTGVETPLKASQVSGIIQNKYHWQVIVRPFNFNPDAVDTTTLATALFKVKVIVSWGDKPYARHVKLVTLKLINKTL